MAETWVEFANSITDEKGISVFNLVAIAEVDCTQHNEVCGQNGIQGYPTLKLFVRGNEPIPYKQARNI